MPERFWDENLATQALSDPVEGVDNHCTARNIVGVHQACRKIVGVGSRAPEVVDAVHTSHYLPGLQIHSHLPYKNHCA